VFFTTSCKTQSSAPEDGRNYRPKHVELIEIVNKFIIFASSWLFLLRFETCREKHQKKRLFERSKLSV
jgi:hypothetical protein